MARWLGESQALFATQRTSGRTMGLYMSMLDFGLWWELRQAFAANSPLGRIAQVSMRLGHTGGLVWSKEPNQHGVRSLLEAIIVSPVFLNK